MVSFSRFAMAPVLRKNHSLQRRSKTPLVKRLRTPDRVQVLARLARDVITDTMNEDDLVTAITNLTGEDPQDLWDMAGHQTVPTEADLSVVLHHAITLANEVGQPLQEVRKKLKEQ